MGDRKSTDGILKPLYMFVGSSVTLLQIYGVEYKTSVYVCSARNKDQKLVGRFLKIGYFIGYYSAVLLKMYGKYGRSK